MSHGSQLEWAIVNKCISEYELLIANNIEQANFQYIITYPWTYQCGSFPSFCRQSVTHKEHLFTYLENCFMRPILQLDCWVSHRRNKIEILLQPHTINICWEFFLASLAFVVSRGLVNRPISYSTIALRHMNKWSGDIVTGFRITVMIYFCILEGKCCYSLFITKTLSTGLVHTFWLIGHFFKKDEATFLRNHVFAFLF